MKLDLKKLKIKKAKKSNIVYGKYVPCETVKVIYNGSLEDLERWHKIMVPTNYYCTFNNIAKKNTRIKYYKNKIK